jgi:hypothetical protein
MGNRFAGLSVALDWVEEHHAVCVTTEYRLAPSIPIPRRWKTASPRCGGRASIAPSWESTRRS